MTEENVEQSVAAPQTEVIDSKPQGEQPTMTAEQYREQGTAALAKADMESAIELFSKALQAKISETGNELDPECASYYFDYGDAMLQQCSQKSDVFGGAIKQAQKQVAVEMIEETNHEDDDDADAAADDGNDENEAGDAKDAQEEPKEEQRTETSGANEPDADVAERNGSGPAAADEQEDEEGDEEEGDEAAEEDIEDVDEPTDLEVAWELLETARVIYSRMDKNQPSVAFGLADCYSRLGDLALENDMDGIADYTQCLDILNSITNDETLSSSQISVKYRALGAVNFKMAIANSLSGESTSALSQFRDAQKALVKVAEFMLGQAFSSDGKSEAGSEAIPIDNIKEAAAKANDDKAGELGDIIDLLEKIQEKIEDLLVAEPMKSTEVTTIVNEIMADAAAAAGVSSGFEPSRDSGGDPSTTVDLGTLIGQKRKMETGNDEDQTEQPAKAAKSD